MKIILKILNKESDNERGANAIKNILASFFVKGMSILISLLLVPLTINYVDPINYGIWITLSSIMAWFSFFDIGFGHGLRNKFTESKSKLDFKSAQIYVATTYISVALIFTVSWIIFYVANQFLDWSRILNAPINLSDDLSTIALIVFTFFCLQMVLKLINVILIADQKPANAAFNDLLGQLLILLITFLLVKYTSGSLVYLAITVSVSPVLMYLIASLFYFQKGYKTFLPSFRNYNKKMAFEILGLGSKFFFLQLGGIIIYQSTNIVIAQILNPEYVTIFNISWKYFSLAIMISAIIFAPYWSAFTDANAKNEKNWMSTTYKTLLKISLLLCAIVLIMIVLAPYFYSIWIGDAEYIPFEINLIIALLVIFTILSSLHFYILNGLSKLRIQIYTIIGGVFLNIPLSIFFGNQFGLVGILLPSVLYNLFSAIIYAYQVNLILNGTAKGNWNK